MFPLTANVSCLVSKSKERHPLLLSVPHPHQRWYSCHLFLVMKTTIGMEPILIATNQMPRGEPSGTEARPCANNPEKQEAPWDVLQLQRKCESLKWLKGNSLPRGRLVCCRMCCYKEFLQLFVVKLFNTVHIGFLFTEFYGIRQEPGYGRQILISPILLMLPHLILPVTFP